MSRLVAPFRARYYCPDAPQATQTSGLCTLGFKKVKAAGLVVVFDHIGPHLLSGELGSTFDDIINHDIGRGGCHNSFVANFSAVRPIKNQRRYYDTPPLLVIYKM